MKTCAPSKKGMAFEATFGTKTKWLFVALLGYVWLPIVTVIYGAKKIGELIPFDEFNFEMGTGLPDILGIPEAELPTQDSQPTPQPKHPAPATRGCKPGCIRCHGSHQRRLL